LSSSLAFALAGSTRFIALFNHAGDIISVVKEIQDRVSSFSSMVLVRGILTAQLVAVASNGRRTSREFVYPILATLKSGLGNGDPSLPI